MTDKTEPALDVVGEIKDQLGPKFRHLAEDVAVEHESAPQAQPDTASDLAHDPNGTPAEQLAWNLSVNDVDERDPDAMLEMPVTLLKSILTTLRSNRAAIELKWGAWRRWHGEDDAGPDLDTEERVNVVRRGPDAKCWLIAEKHHIDWKHVGSVEDILLFRRSLNGDDHG